MGYYLYNVKAEDIETYDVYGRPEDAIARAQELNDSDVVVMERGEHDAVALQIWPPTCPACGASLYEDDFSGEERRRMTMQNNHNLPAAQFGAVQKLTEEQARSLARQLCAPPMPATDEGRREALCQYLADGGSLQDLH